MRVKFDQILSEQLILIAKRDVSPWVQSTERE